MDKIIIEYTFTAETAKQDTAFFARRKLYLFNIFLIAVAAAAIVFFFLTKSEYCIFLLITAFISMLSLLFSVAAAKKNAVKRFAVLYHGNCPDIKITFDDMINIETIRADAPPVYKQIEYGALKKIRKSKNSLYLFFDGNLILSLPYTAFKTATPQALIALLKEKNLSVK